MIPLKSGVEKALLYVVSAEDERLPGDYFLRLLGKRDLLLVFHWIVHHLACGAMSFICCLLFFGDYSIGFCNLFICLSCFRMSLYVYQ